MNVQRVRVENFFLAYNAPMADREPTADEYNQMRDLTTEYFTNYFTGRYANDTAVKFLTAESGIKFNLYQAGIPAQRFNIYMQYNYTDLIYTVDSTPPSAAESFIIMRDSITAEYILNYVRNATNTPFDSTQEVVFRASTLTEPPTNGTKSGNKLQRTTDGSDGNGDSVPVATLAATSAAALVIFIAGLLVYRRKRSFQRGGNYDGIYAMDNKALEGYFSERSVTDVSESPSRFPPLPMVKEEESRPLQVRV
jgi:hypothetical protein